MPSRLSQGRAGVEAEPRQGSVAPAVYHNRLAYLRSVGARPARRLQAPAKPGWKTASGNRSAAQACPAQLSREAAEGGCGGCLPPARSARSPEDIFRR